MMRKIFALLMVCLIASTTAYALQVQPLQKVEKNIIAQTHEFEEKEYSKHRKYQDKPIEQKLINNLARGNVPEPEIIYDILETEINGQNLMLAGTDLGLYVYVIDGETFQLTELNGLPTGDVFSIERDGDILALGTENGLFAIDLGSNNPVFQNFDAGTKYYALEMFNYDDVKYLAAGTSNGLWIVDLDQPALVIEVPVNLNGQEIGEFYEILYWEYNGERYLLFGMEHGAAGFKMEPDDWQFGYLGDLWGQDYQYYGEFATYSLEPIYYGDDVYFAIGTNLGLFIRDMSDGSWSSAYEGEQIVNVHQSEELNKVIINTAEGKNYNWDY